MNKILLLVSFTLTITIFKAQDNRFASVELTAIVQTNNPQITLNWLPNASATSYKIYRKLKTASAWETILATVSGTTNTYVDTAVAIGTSYEYKIQRFGVSSHSGFGYINSGIEIPAIEQRGILILLIDSSFTLALSNEIKRLEDDLIGDGWHVIRHDVSPNSTVASVKETIVADYNLNPTNTKAVFLFGHIPVPYSGNIYPDGHPDHEGAWPADVYYADMDGTWTDGFVNNTVANSNRNYNIPSDGKFDQSNLPSPAELQIGRVDFDNMPAFAFSEQQLLKNYLDKDHDYRNKVFTANRRAVIDDNFGFFNGEAFAASGWKNFSPLVGTANVEANDYFTTTNGNSYLWSYGCGSGSYTSCNGIGNTTNFSVSNLGSIFTMLFGSYFGDWDSQNNLLRAPLAQGKTLTNCWSGRPHWQFHHMALGENIGYSVRVSQNNTGFSSLYFFNNNSNSIHIALMGDPSLRNDVVAPVSNVVATTLGTNCNISWTASTDSVLGYYIYMKNDTTANYIRINSNLISGTSFIDSCLNFVGTYTYMVRALKLETTPSGTYFNLSTGISDTTLNSNIPVVNAAANFSIENNAVTFTNASLNANFYSWNFGDGVTSSQQNPTNTYLAAGNYTATLTASNDCAIDTISFLITIPVSIGIEDGLNDAQFVSVYPNPSNGNFTIEFDNIANNSAGIMIFNNLGKIVYQTEKADKIINVSHLSPGIYFYQTTSDDENSRTGKIIIQ